LLLLPITLFTLYTINNKLYGIKYNVVKILETNYVVFVVVVYNAIEDKLQLVAF